MAIQRAPAKRGKGPTQKPAPKNHRRQSVLAFGMIGVGLGLLVAAAFAFGLVSFKSGASELAGAIVNPPATAPDFQLRDQFDQPVRLSSFHGKVTVLTFLYTNCPDACPLITQKLHQAYDQLGNDTDHLAIVAVTVDPAHDTIAQVRSYSVQKDMLQKWHFLVGTPRELAPVWGAYGIEAANADAEAVQARTTAVALNAATPTPLAGTGLVDHSAPIFIIDPTGKMRAVLDIDFAPADLVQDVRALK